ncbi:MAG: hypothetical protein KDD06_25740 [Phaeodactylibacter sp.]|nr:hypothetical protein [Phaeodactylibacter sp.]MCB9264190.1 hypothetical protein [Lewinellaceae bacterium]MCB9290634.1 hypothetical protein [Lewinellaceae bacterium]
MAITVKEVAGKKELSTFIQLPARIHAGHGNWLPPLYMDEWEYFNPGKNKSFSHCDTVLYLAYRDGAPAGRLMGIINKKYNALHGEKTARFAHFECFEDEAVAFALLDAVEEWGRQKGMEEIIGPFGFSEKDPQGFLIKGFDELPVIATSCNLPYMPQFVEKKGYGKKMDCFDFLIDLKDGGIPVHYSRIFERVKRNPHFRLLEFESRKELRPYIVPVFELVNEAYKDIFGFQPLDEGEVKFLADRYLPLLNPRYVKIVADDAGKVIAFFIGVPNMTKGIQRSKGKLFPFGFLHILASARKAKQLDLLLGAIDDKYRGMGIDILMAWPMIQQALQAGIERLETHLVSEDNKAMLAEYQRINARMHKQFRIFRKTLNGVN